MLSRVLKISEGESATNALQLHDAAICKYFNGFNKFDYIRKYVHESCIQTIL